MNGVTDESVAGSERKSPATGSALTSGRCHNSINSEEPTGKCRAALRNSSRLCISAGKDVVQHNPSRPCLPGESRPNPLCQSTLQNCAYQKASPSDPRPPAPNPAIRAATAGTPRAAASSKVMRNGSYQRLGNTRKRAPFIWTRTSLALSCPGNLIAPPDCAPFAKLHRARGHRRQPPAECAEVSAMHPASPAAPELRGVRNG